MLLSPLTQAFEGTYYCERDASRFLLLEVSNEIFNVEFGNKPPIEDTFTWKDFKATQDELISTKFTIKVYDDKNTNAYMFNKFTKHLVLKTRESKKDYEKKIKDSTYFHPTKSDAYHYQCAFIDGIEG